MAGSGTHLRPGDNMADSGSQWGEWGGGGDLEEEEEKK